MTMLLLIRHAPTAETGVRLTGRLPGVSLHPPGLAAARALADRLRGVRLKALFASPVERTWETAVEVGKPHRLTPVRHAGLIEVDFGAWSGRTLKSLYPLKAWRTVLITPSRMTFPGGEALTTVQARAVAVCEEVAAGHRNATVGLVSHGDVIRLALSHFLGQPLDLFHRIGVAPASVSVIELPPGGPPRVRVVNGNGDPETWL